jgi:dipeptidyl aminopeptidase/acylaminoacyl peptidase
VDEDCAAIAFAPDGRIAYAVRRIVTIRKYDVQRDDIWVTTLDGKKKRIVNGERLVQGNALFSYAIQSLRWSPDGTRLTVEMLTRQENPQGETHEGRMNLLIEESGKEIKIRGGDSVIPDATNATWLADGVTVVYLTETAKPGLLYAVNFVRPVSGRGGRLFENHAFAAVAWDAKRSAAVAIEHDPSLSGPTRLVWLDLQKEMRRELAELPSYLGGLTLSPSGSQAAYFSDREKLEIRRIAQPDHVTRVQAAFGSYAWLPDEQRILVKRGLPRRSGDLLWLHLPDGSSEPALRDLTFRDFQISPDSRYLAVTAPGKRTLYVYAIQSQISNPPAERLR